MVTILKTNIKSYPQKPPFHPSEIYPEYPFKGAMATDVTNRVYTAVRDAIKLSGADNENFGTAHWNPMNSYVKPGDKVLIKPNLVRQYHSRGFTVDSMVSHGSIIRAIIDYVLIALKGEGEIVIGDAPLQYADFNLLIEQNGLKKVVDFVKASTNIKVNLIDFRYERSEKNLRGLIKKRIRISDKNSCAVFVDLAQNSFFTHVQEKYNHFRVSDFEPEEMKKHHNLSKHEYIISKYVLDANTVINVPKFKTHKKAGITVAMKNLVGVNASKNCLPHHTIGSVKNGGDEYTYRSIRKSIQTYLLDIIESTKSEAKKYSILYLRKSIGLFKLIVPYRDNYRQGSWYGNDTLWRTILDINYILLYADHHGHIQKNRQRKHLCFVDGIVCGEGNGPMDPDPRPCGLILVGQEMVFIDYVCALLMGFFPDAIPTIKNGLKSSLFADSDPKSLKIISNNNDWSSPGSISKNNLKFKPAFGWENIVRY